MFALFASGCAQQPVAPQGAPSAPAAVPAPPAAVSPNPAPGKPTPRNETNAASIEQGKVSLYGVNFAGKTTASGERFDPDAFTMAHRTLPFGTRVRVTNLQNHRSVEVRVNDRGPTVRGRIADISAAAARALGMTEDGVIDATLQVVGSAAE